MHGLLWLCFLFLEKILKMIFMCFPGINIILGGGLNICSEKMRMVQYNLKF